MVKFTSGDTHIYQRQTTYPAHTQENPVQNQPEPPHRVDARRNVAKVGMFRPDPRIIEEEKEEAKAHVKKSVENGINRVMNDSYARADTRGPG